MITDQETNFVYFSELLKTIEVYSQGCDRITAILDKYQIKYDFLKGTKDIWARDYMPIQTDVNRFIQFRYEPSYLKDKLYLQSNPTEICNNNHFTPIPSKVNLDGGNVVKWHNKVMITERIFSENPEYSDHSSLIKKIENRLEVECIIIPQINAVYDFTGHADGLVKFVNESTVLGSDMEFEFKYWATGMKKVVDRFNLEYINMPSFYFKDKNFPDTAIGCYLNYLEIRDLIIFPIFEVTDNKDQQAVDIIKRIYPNKHIETININQIARHGGLMNCISWNIKTQ